ncbi:cholinesterase [Bombina bombina]|uniref:cholinesterase n=1 Tax=Bombina bombina TaxID=8345 RepID=UPI00235A8E4B|nr:cholinesterase [Bombina bombina]
MLELRKVRFLKIYLLVTYALYTQAQDDTIVQTKQGKVSGIHLPVLSGSVTAYLGIPYGEPPTGAQRFKKSEPRKPWQGTYNATEFGRSCYQNKQDIYSEFTGTAMWLVNNEMSEDCLFLNIWVPSSKSKPFPVMVFIHGGGFVSGTTSLDIYDGHILSYYEDVIVVSMNYRVGALGFLALPENKNAPGNAGLFDQMLALQWIHENIEVFGGNPHNVTLFGHSAGALSVAYHVISSGSHAFFTNAIIQSGSVFADFGLHDKVRRSTLKLAQYLGCPLKDDDAVVTCLQNIDAMELTEKQLSVKNSDSLLIFAPVIDKDFLSDYLNKLINQTLKEKSLLLGVTKDDGNPFAIMGVPGFSLKNESLITFTQLQAGLRHYFHSFGDLATESILLQYTNWEDVDNQEKNRKAMEQVVTDHFFLCPTKLFANKLSEHKNSVYFYVYDHRISNEVWPEWMGTVHGAELPILFGKPLIASNNYTESEKVFSKRIMKFWTNFARYGAPTAHEEVGFTWPLYSNEEQKYVVLKLNNTEIHHKLKSHHCQFWNSYFPKLVRRLAP